MVCILSLGYGSSRGLMGHAIDLTHDFSEQAKTYHKAMMTVAVQPSVGFVAQQACYTFKGLVVASDGFWDRLTLLHHVCCLGRLVSELTCDFQVSAPQDPIIVAKFIATASATIQLMAVQILHHDQDFPKDHTDR